MLFQHFVGPEGRKVGSAKAAVGEMRDLKLLWWEAHFELKMSQAPRAPTTCGSGDVGKVRAAAA